MLFKNASGVLAVNPLKAIRWKGSPATDTRKLPTAYGGGSNPTSDVVIIISWEGFVNCGGWIFMEGA